MGDAGGKPGYQKADVRIAREGQAHEVSSGCWKLVQGPAICSGNDLSTLCLSPLP